MALPAGSKSAFIRANQVDWNNISQVLAQDTIYNVEKQGGVIQQGGTEPDFLKNTYNAGQYDIAKPVGGGTAASGYSLNPTLAYSQASAASSSKYKPLVPLPKIKFPRKGHIARLPKSRGFRAPHIKKANRIHINANGRLNPTKIARPTHVVKLA
jgi:hypothetical protein